MAAIARTLSKWSLVTSGATQTSVTLTVSQAARERRARAAKAVAAREPTRVFFMKDKERVGSEWRPGGKPRPGILAHPRPFAPLPFWAGGEPRLKLGRSPFSCLKGSHSILERRR